MMRREQCQRKWSSKRLLNQEDQQPTEASCNKDEGKIHPILWRPIRFKKASACLTMLAAVVLYFLRRSFQSVAQHKNVSYNGLIITPSTSDKRATTRQPTHRACDGYTGIYHIQSGDVGGAAATIFFQFVVAQLIYAERYNLKPWIYLNNISHHVYDQVVHNHSGVTFTMMRGMQVEHVQDQRLRRAKYPGRPYNVSALESHVFSFSGDGVWEQYFEPVSDFIPGDKSCQSKPLVTMDLWSLTPGLHIYAPWTPRMWRYENILPDYLQQRHLTLREWLTPQRLRAHDMVQKYIRPKMHLWEQADRVLRGDDKQSHSDRPLRCIGMHVRWSDKGGGRRLIGVGEFLPYVEAFLDRGHGNCVFVATDASHVWQQIQKQWPERVRQLLRWQGDHIARSNDTTPVFELTQSPTTSTKAATTLISHHRTNTEVLVDILALSRCQFILHGHSAVSDSAMYLNKNLIHQGVNLEDPEDFDVLTFGSMVHDVLEENLGVDRGRYFPEPWWKQTHQIPDARKPPENSGCEGYRGVLLIASGGSFDFSFGMTFFHTILNQLLYADIFNLKPWIHLSKEKVPTIHDDAVHGDGDRHVSTATMMVGTNPKKIVDNDGVGYYPGDLDLENSKLIEKSFSLSGNGVWESYLEPVDLSLSGNALSCRGKPLVTMDDDMIVPGLHKWAPWSIKSFRYSGIPNHVWVTGGDNGGVNSNVTQSDSVVYLRMRKKAHELVNKYYRFHPFIWKRVREVNPIGVSSGAKLCLAMHIRQGDKEGYGKRKPGRIRDYQPFVEAFFRVVDETPGTTQDHAVVYLATDSWRVMDAISENWPSPLKSRIRSQGDRVVRSVRWVPAHMQEPDNHHRVNLEALVDVLAMSQCQFIVHGFSTISEAAIYINLDLHHRSVNVDEPTHMTAAEFEALVRRHITSFVLL